METYRSLRGRGRETRAQRGYCRLDLAHPDAVAVKLHVRFDVAHTKLKHRVHRREFAGPKRCWRLLRGGWSCIGCLNARAAKTQFGAFADHAGVGAELVGSDDAILVRVHPLDEERVDAHLVLGDAAIFVLVELPHQNAEPVGFELLRGGFGGGAFALEDALAAESGDGFATAHAFDELQHRRAHGGARRTELGHERLMLAEGGGIQHLGPRAVLPQRGGELVHACFLVRDGRAVRDDDLEGRRRLRTLRMNHG